MQLAVFDSLHGRRGARGAGSCKSFHLPTCSRDFVGRTKALEAVSQELNQSHGTVIGQSISGLGGVGKTQLALQYAHAAVEGLTVGGRRLSYDYVMWLNAETYLEGQFQAMAEVWLGEKELSGPEAVEAIYQRMLAGKRSLIVFDNAENAQAFD